MRNILLVVLSYNLPNLFSYNLPDYSPYIYVYIHIYNNHIYTHI